MKYIVYVLRSLKTGRRYIGSTNNLERRIIEHNTGQSTYTSQTGPYKLMYSEEFMTNIEVRRREKYFKTGIGREYLDSIQV